MESILTAWEDNMGGCGEGKVPFFVWVEFFHTLLVNVGRYPVWRGHL